MQSIDAPGDDVTTLAGDDPSGAELCLANYCARQVAGCVVLYANGIHQSSGCVVFFRRDPGAAFPPHFSLWHVHSGASELHAVTPFSVSVSFQTMKQVPSVLVTDATGRHLVTVEEKSETAHLHR